MRRHDNQIGTFPCSALINAGWAESGRCACIDWNTIEIDAFQESSHLIATSASRRYGISRRVVLAATTRHHDRAKIRNVEDDDAGTKALSECDRIF